MVYRAPKIIVVGAGLAGLTAANTLFENDIDVLVVEASDRVGGRTLSRNAPSDVVLDMGAQWIGPGQYGIARMLKEFGLSTARTHADGDNIFHFEGLLQRFKGINPGLKEDVLNDVSQVQGQLDQLASLIDCNAPWSSDGALELDRTTLWQWLTGSAQTPGGLRFMTCLAEGIWAVHPSQISLLHALFYVNSAGGFDKLASCEGGAQQDFIVNGSQQLSERIADKLKRRVVLNNPVTRIDQFGNALRVTYGNNSIVADRAIVAVPPPLISTIRFEPPLPSARDTLNQRSPMGHVIKFSAVYRTAFWREDDLCGQVVSDDGLVRLTFDSSPSEGRPGVLTGFIEADNALLALRLTAADRTKAVVECLSLYFGHRARDYIGYEEKCWDEAPWTRGGYGSVPGPGVLTAVGTAVRDPYGHVHWAGSETATIWNGYMEGAIQSGLSSARRVLETLNGEVGK